MKPNPYQLYELSVQSPKWQVDYLPQFHEWLTGKSPKSFREDFSGSGKIACEWVKKSKKHTAIGLDIDPNILTYANEVNRDALSKDQKKRVKFLNQNVLIPTKETADWIGAFNFSIFCFHERSDLLAYFRAALKSLKKSGTLFLEIAGGPEFISEHRYPKKVKIPGYGIVTQVWEQHQFDPITSVCDYSIHFQLKKGIWLQNAFTYHWRIWSIREIREALEEAGFKKSVVLWEQLDKKGEPKGEYLPTENASLSSSFVAYVVGVKD